MMSRVEYVNGIQCFADEELFRRRLGIVKKDYDVRF